MLLDVERYRGIASSDVISQALNYSFQYPENSSGKEFWYPINNKNGQCIYSRMHYYINDISPNFNQKKTELRFGALNGEQIDLNKGDPKTIKISRQTINVGLFGGSLYQDFYNVSIEGIGMPISSGSVNSCDPDRLYRAWRLIYSKCAGRKSNF